MDEQKDIKDIFDKTPEQEAQEAIEAEKQKEAEKEAEKKKLLSQNAKEWIVDIVGAIAIALVILFFFKPSIVQEHSMENTLENNDFVFVSKQSYKLFGEMKRGDVIVFQSNLPMEGGGSKFLVKRIIGLPGDTIEIKDGITYLNGEAQEETYTKEGITVGDMNAVVVEEEHLFVMGDNRQNSADSRSIAVGQVPFEDVIGKVVFRVYPLDKFGRIK